MERQATGQARVHPVQPGNCQMLFPGRTDRSLGARHRAHHRSLQTGRLPHARMESGAEWCVGGV